MAIEFCCGAECQIAVGPTIGRDRHWNAMSGTPTTDTSQSHGGSRSFKFAVNTTQRLDRDFLTGAEEINYCRFYFRVDSVAPSGAARIFTLVTGGSQNLAIEITTAGVLRCFESTGTQNYSGTMVANEWYGIELQFDGRANPNLTDWRVWRAETGWVLQTQVSFAQAAVKPDTCQFGWAAATTGPNLWIDDIVVGAGPTIDADWSDTEPHGGVVLAYRPNADGTHSFASSGDFKYENTTNFASSATDVYTHLDAADMTQTAEFISQNVNTSAGTLTKYCEILFADESNWTDVQFVEGIMVFRSAATQANEMNVRASDNGSDWTNLEGNWGTSGIDISETSNQYSTIGMATPPSGGSWTQAKVNGLRMQFGMSDDVSPVPFVCGLAFEVAWLENKRPVDLLYPLQAVQRASAW